MIACVCGLLGDGKRDHKVESAGYKIVIAEQWDPASLFDESVIEKQ